LPGISVNKSRRPGGGTPPGVRSRRLGLAFDVPEICGDCFYLSAEYDPFPSQSFVPLLGTLQENSVPDSRADYGEYAALQWTRTQLCRQLRELLPRQQPDRAPIRVGTDVTFYYDPADRLGRVTPDIYVLPGFGYEEQLRSFRVYERGLRPSLVVHLVETSLSAEDGLLMHFVRLGVNDVVLYDPLWWVWPGAGGLRGRRLLTHYRRASGPGGGEILQLQPQEHPGRIYLPQYRLWLVHRGGAELRAYGDQHGQDERGTPCELDCQLLSEERPPPG
jgi:hypothetical protein